MSKVIKNSLLYRFNVGVYKDEKAGGYYDRYSKAMSERICQFMAKSINIEINIQKESGSNRGKVTEVVI